MIRFIKLLATNIIGFAIIMAFRENNEKGKMAKEGRELESSHTYFNDFPIF